MLPEPKQEAQQEPAPRVGYRDMQIGQLVDKRATILDTIERLKLALVDLDDEILKRIDVTSIFDRKDKSYGEVTEKIDGQVFRAKITKTVKWDSDLLLGVAKKMPWEAASSLFDIDFSMGERKHTALSAQAGSGDVQAAEVLKAINEARTVKFSEPKLVSVERI